MGSRSLDALETVVLPTAFIRELGEATSVKGVLDVVSTWLPSIVDADRASIALAVDDGTALEVYSMGGSEAIDVGVVLPVDGTIAGRAYRQRRPVGIAQLTPEHGMSAVMLLEAGLHTCLDAPLLSGGECFGTINLGHSRPGHFGSRTTTILDALARLVATTIRVHREVETIAVLAETDSLTGLANRRTFDASIQQAWDRLQRADLEFGLALFDLDNFKEINDRYGHPAGDEVLQVSADALRNGVRSGDVVARLGGEEFGAVCPGLTSQTMATWAERMRMQIARQSVAFDGDHIMVTVSIGTTTATRRDTDIADVMRRADRALYAAKENGRNRVVNAPTVA